MATWIDNAAAYHGVDPADVITESLSGSPWNWTNTGARSAMVHVTGGLTVGITLTMDGDSVAVSYLAGGTIVPVRTGASISVTWLTAPTIKRFEI